MKMTALDKVAHLLVVIGGLNWGLVGFFEYDLVGELFGFTSGLTRIIYGLVGLAAVVVLYRLVTSMSDNQ